MEDRRSRQLHQLRKVIEAGAYRIDPVLVADAILRRGELDELPAPAPPRHRRGPAARRRRAA